MRIDCDGQAIYEVTVLLTPDEAQEVIRALEMLRDVVPSSETDHPHAR